MKSSRKQKGTFNPLRLYYELSLKSLGVTREYKRKPSETWEGNEVFACMWHSCVFSQG